MTSTLDKQVAKAEEQLAKAEERHQAARQQARELQAQRDALTAKAKREADLARDRFEARRRKEFPAFEKRVRQAYDRFFAVVADGGDWFAAYLAYRRAKAQQFGEQARFTGWIYRRQTEAWERNRQTLKEFKERLGPLAAELSRHDEMMRNRPKASRHAAPAALTEALRLLNAEVNQWAQDQGVDYRRDTGDHTAIPSDWRILGDQPSHLAISTGTVGAPRPLVEMLAEAIEKAAAKYQQEYVAEMREEIASLTPDEGTVC